VLVGLEQNNNGPRYARNM